MLIVTLPGKVLRIELESIGVQYIIAPKIESSSMKVLSAVLDDRIDSAAPGASVLCVVGIGHHLEFVNSVDIGRYFPLPGVGARLLRDRRTIQSELVIEPGHAVN